MSRPSRTRPNRRIRSRLNSHRSDVSDTESENESHGAGERNSGESAPMVEDEASERAEWPYEITPTTQEEMDRVVMLKSRPWEMIIV